MNQKALALGLVGAGAGLAAGLLYIQHARSDARRAQRVPREAPTQEEHIHWLQRIRNREAAGEQPEQQPARRRLVLLANPGPSRTRMIAGAGSGLLAAWGSARGGLLGSAVGIAGAALLSRIAAR